MAPVKVRALLVELFVEELPLKVLSLVLAVTLALNFLAALGGAAYLYSNGALSKEKTVEAKARLEEIERELAEQRESSTRLRTQWSSEKEAIQKIRESKEAIEQTRQQALEAEREGNLQNAAELRYGRLPQLERDLAAQNTRLAELQQGTPMLQEEVTEEDIADVVSRWTGVPVSKMLEREAAKLLEMENRIGARVVGGGFGGGGARQVDLGGLHGPAAEHDARVRGEIADRVEDLAGCLRLAVERLDERVDDLDRRRDVFGHREHVQQRRAGAAQGLAEHEREFDLDARRDETVDRDVAARREEHVVHQRRESGSSIWLACCIAREVRPILRPKILRPSASSSATQARWIA